MADVSSGVYQLFVSGPGAGAGPVKFSDREMLVPARWPDAKDTRDGVPANAPRIARVSSGVRGVSVHKRADASRAI